MEQTMDISSFLPGTLTVRRGSLADYRTLASFHYLGSRPATFAAIAAIDYRATGQTCCCPRYGRPPCGGLRIEPARTVGVAVLSWPVPSCGARDRRFGLLGQSRRDKIVWANANIRTVSRVIVHPQFRSLGLSTVLVDWLCEHCDTRYIESMAKMGNAHPFFERAGFTRIGSDDPEAPVYFLKDRAASQLRIAA